MTKHDKTLKPTQDKCPESIEGKLQAIPDFRASNFKLQTLTKT